MDGVKIPKVTSIRSALNWKNAWRIRVVVLSCIVIVLGVGSQIVVNAFVTNADAYMQTPVPPYVISSTTANGQLNREPNPVNWTLQRYHQAYLLQLNG